MKPFSHKRTYLVREGGGICLGKEVGTIYRQKGVDNLALYFFQSGGREFSGIGFEPARTCRADEYYTRRISPKSIVKLPVSLMDLAGIEIGEKVEVRAIESSGTIGGSIMSRENQIGYQKATSGGKIDLSDLIGIDTW
jgi:hypothetical protein